MDLAIKRGDIRDAVLLGLELNLSTKVLHLFNSTTSELEKTKLKELITNGMSHQQVFCD
jgi:hypothetical protein